MFTAVHFCTIYIHGDARATLEEVVSGRAWMREEGRDVDR